MSKTETKEASENSKQILKDAEQKLTEISFNKATVEAIDTLLQSGANINIKDEYGETPLIKALFAQNLPVAEFLINKGADFNVTNMAGHTPMMICVKNGLIDIAELLIQKGDDIHKPSPENEESLLATAVWENQEEMAKWLLEKGIDVNKTDVLGWTPLMISACLGLTDITKILLSFGADKDKRQQRNWTALDLATFYNHADIVELLM